MEKFTQNFLHQKTLLFHTIPQKISAKPFKIKNVQEEDPINAKDLNVIHEQNNYTNKYLKPLENTSSLDQKLLLP